MENRKRVLNEFLDKIHQIEKELDKLESLSYEISESYNTGGFPEQEDYSMNKLENLLIAVTHETASQIGFYRNTIQNLTKFIEFREKHNKFTDKELAEIIDENLSLNLKQSLSKRFVSIQDMLTQVNSVKQDWNSMFNNNEYTKISKQLRI